MEGRRREGPGRRLEPRADDSLRFVAEALERFLGRRQVAGKDSVEDSRVGGFLLLTVRYGEDCFFEVLCRGIT